MRSLIAALPYALPLAFLPLIALGALYGNSWVLLTPLAWLIGLSILDLISGLDQSNLDVETEASQIRWHRFPTLIWLPLQIVMIYGCIYAVTQTDVLDGAAPWGLMIAVGFITGPIGIVFAHELFHQRNKFERRSGEWLMISVLYGHFVTEHLHVHHAKVATAEDSATARYNEGLYTFLARVLPGSLRSAWAVEAERLARRERSRFDLANPFWRYGLGAVVFLVFAYLIGGWAGVGWYILQAGVAVYFLETVNYIEHYGLTRKYYGDGKFERASPKHSWNSGHIFSNWFLINLSRHSDHHTKPDRRFPLLQSYGEIYAPHHPYGSSVMVIMAQIPWAFRRVMNPRVRRWRSMFYPEITDWSGYRNGSHPS